MSVQARRVEIYGLMLGTRRKPAGGLMLESSVLIGGRGVLRNLRGVESNLACMGVPWGEAQLSMIFTKLQLRHV